MSTKVEEKNETNREFEARCLQIDSYESTYMYVRKVLPLSSLGRFLSFIRGISVWSWLKCRSLLHFLEEQTDPARSENTQLFLARKDI